MDTIIFASITLLVCMILIISYFLFGKEQQRKKKDEFEKYQLICDFYKQEIRNIKKLQLEGTGSDGNSDFEFIQAVKKINLPNNVRVQIYD